jgi:hypothetical protein
LSHVVIGIIYTSNAHLGPGFHLIRVISVNHNNDFTKKLPNNLITGMQSGFFLFLIICLQNLDCIFTEVSHWKMVYS